MKVNILVFSATFLLMAFCRHAYSDDAMSFIEGIEPEPNLGGFILLKQTSEGLEITGGVSNASPGMHGFHIHELGSCADGGKAAGGHFNPDGNPHGLLSRDGFEKAHAGDLGNIEVFEDGNAVLNITVPGLSLEEGKYNVMGKAFILHEKEDDFGQPTGNAGARIGCGIIET